MLDVLYVLGTIAVLRRDGRLRTWLRGAGKGEGKRNIRHERETWIAAGMAVTILGYLMYTLIRPEKF